jgi:o-succinylbenzoate synthase
MKASYFRYNLDFKQAAGTSRGVLHSKESWFIVLEQVHKKGIGECGILRGLSYDDRPDYEDKLRWVCEHIHLGEAQLWEELREFPSIQFGLEMAFLSLESATPFELFPSNFTLGIQQISINGLVWMGDIDFMKTQLDDKIAQGFRCVKLKIGALDFEQELDLLRQIRSHFSADQIEIRLDANCAFTAADTLAKLQQLAVYQIHSIEQPLAINQRELLGELLQTSPIPIALDEELIGLTTLETKRNLLEQCKPAYLIFKPSFIGGIKGTLEWIALANEFGIAWWITSALESNIGLNAIAQFTATLNNALPQGLGTGALYTNNFDCPLQVNQGFLSYNPAIDWQVNLPAFTT